MKDFYIAPEVEILCFAPFENLASDGWGFGGNGIFSDGEGVIPGGASDPVETTLPDDDSDGEG